MSYDHKNSQDWLHVKDKHDEEEHVIFKTDTSPERGTMTLICRHEVI